MKIKVDVVPREKKLCHLFIIAENLAPWQRDAYCSPGH